MASELRIDDLEDLWRAGAVLLPTVAIQYAELARKLHQTALNEDGAFGRTGSNGRLQPVWTALRDTMQDTIAVKTHNNLIAAGEALRQIAESYATTEYLSVEDLAEFRNKLENGDGDPVFEPPAYVPHAPRTDDSHPEQAPVGSGYY